MNEISQEGVPLSHALGNGTVGQPPRERPCLKTLAARVLEGAREPVPLSHVIGNGTAGQSAKSPKSERADEWDAEDFRAFYEERAAILEYDGELGRPEAERQALDASIIQWMNLSPPPNIDPDHCAQCGNHVGQIGDDAVPFLTGGGGHIWLHHGCHAAWAAHRRREAIEAITAIGIVCRAEI